MNLKSLENAPDWTCVADIRVVVFRKGISDNIVLLRGDEEIGLMNLTADDIEALKDIVEEAEREGEE